MSAKNGAKNKARRREQRALRDSARSETIVHGICRDCSRRRQLWMPARLCEPCLLASPEAAAVLERIANAFSA